eukprot:TRINITY_DN8822_c0_g1_i1.p1 TRINITY_DN8822_c0_g1~~TRINITY_DN8822_c0_g1_i1.p1  ORF type:complete len:351 (-),score=78.01 TRINITY_DN8822_c0_g1_i1:78-1130(-)
MVDTAMDTTGSSSGGGGKSSSSNDDNAQQQNQRVTVDGDASSTLSVSLHPLVIINVSDQHTRLRVKSVVSLATGSGRSHPSELRVIGALLGTQTGRDIEIFNSFEVMYMEVEGLIVLDMDYLREKLDQFTKVFSTYDFLGWYSTGPAVQAEDTLIHKQIMELNESPLFLLLDPMAAEVTQTRELPISLYESEMHIIEDKPTLVFSRIPYKIETGEAERIAVDHVARVSSAGGTVESSKLSSQLMNMHNAISMLSMRIQIIEKFLRATAEGKIPKDHGLLRQIVGLCSMLPALDTPSFQSALMKEYNDTLLLTFLASITQGCNHINDLITKCNIAYQGNGGKRSGLHVSPL